MMQNHFQHALEKLQAKGIPVCCDDKLPSDNSSPIYRLQPTTPQQTAQVLAWGKAQGLPIAFSAQAAQSLANPLWLELAGMKKIDHAYVSDFIVQVESGVTFGELADTLAETGQAFPLTYPRDTTIGDILSTDQPALESGLLGYPRDYVLKTEIATPDGQLTTSGANVVKNVTGYDLHKFYVGGRNAFGVITQVTLKLVAKPGLHRYLVTALRTPYQAADIARTVQSGPVPPALCELFWKDGWQLLAGFIGEADWLDQGVDHWLDHEAHTWKTLENENAEDLLQELRQWPDNHAVLEVALPTSCWAEFVDTLSQWDESEHWSIQARPLAGLVYLLWDGDNFCSWVIQQPIAAFELFARLKKLAETKDGFIQWAQWPNASFPVVPPQKQEHPACNDSPCKETVQKDASFWERAACFNLPDDPVIRHLLHALKKSYDPDNILYTPEFALCANAPGFSV